MRDDLGRVDATGFDQRHERTEIVLRLDQPGTHGETLRHYSHHPGHRNIALWHDADHRDATVVANDIDGIANEFWNPDGLDRTIGAATVCEFEHPLFEIHLRRIDADAAGVRRARQPPFVDIDCDDDRRTSNLRAALCKRAHRPATEYDHNVPRPDFCEIGTHISGRQNVGQEQTLLVVHVLGNCEQVRIGERHECGLSLTALSHRTSEHVRIGNAAGRLLASTVMMVVAMGAVSATDCARNQYAITLLEATDRLSRIFDHTTEFVPQQETVDLHRGCVPHMKIGTADRSPLDLHDDILLVFDLRIGKVVVADIFIAVQNEAFH